VSGFRSPGIDRQIWLATSGGLIAGGTGALILAQIEAPGRPRQSAWFAGAVALLVLGGIVFTLALLGSVRAVIEARESPFGILYESRDPDCWTQVNERSFQYRMRVENTGRIGLARVRAQVRVPGSQSHWLRLRHDNTPPFVRSLEGEVLPAADGYWIYFDLLFASDGMSWVEYADNFLRASSARCQTEPLALTVTVWGNREDNGRTVRPKSGRFRFDFRAGQPPALHQEQ
jgi:hypothetical protein